MMPDFGVTLFEDRLEKTYFFALCIIVIRL